MLCKEVGSGLDKYYFSKVSYYTTAQCKGALHNYIPGVAFDALSVPKTVSSIHSYLLLRASVYVYSAQFYAYSYVAVDG